MLLTTPAVQAQEISYLAQVGDGQFGDVIRLITEFIFVNSGADTQVNLAFKLPDGSPMTLNLVGIGPVTEHDFELASGASASFSTMGEGDPNVGYAVVTAGGLLAGGSSGSGVGGTGVFTQIDVPSGTIINEAGLPLVKELSAFSLFVDTTGTRDTAVAIVNTGSPVSAGVATTPTQTALLSLFTISGGADLATAAVEVPAGKQVNKFIGGPGGYFDPEQVPELEDFQGSVTVTNANPGDGSMWAALTVRTNNLGAVFPEGVPTFTAFPVVPGAAALVSSGVMGTVSQESLGRLNVALDLGNAARFVKGAIFYVYDNGELISEEVRAVDTLDLASFMLKVRRGSGPVDVEVRLIYEGGEIPPRMPIQ